MDVASHIGRPRGKKYGEKKPHSFVVGSPLPFKGKIGRASRKSSRKIWKEGEGAT